MEERGRVDEWSNRIVHFFPIPHPPPEKKVRCAPPVDSALDHLLKHGCLTFFSLHPNQLPSGKYAVKGYPHKLGLLLHGPPGTGKTSLIKALACHTDRHIIEVSLGRIKTNSVSICLCFLSRIAFELSPGCVQHAPSSRLDFTAPLYRLSVVMKWRTITLRMNLGAYSSQWHKNQEGTSSCLSVMPHGVHSLLFLICNPFHFFAIEARSSWYPLSLSHACVCVCINC